MMKVQWTIRAGFAMHYLTLEYNNSRDVIDCTATQVMEWKKEGYIRVRNDRFILYHAIDELCYIEEKQ
jgi:hypothetical protein